jgi:Type I phosphodiesterase / nucleotide pyrophosphatase
MRLAVLGLAVGMLLPAQAAAWGFTGHRLVNRKATATLPPPLRNLFVANADYLAEHAIDPDLWRDAGRPGEGVNHYLDMDAFGEWPFHGTPRKENEHLGKFGAKARDRGRVPWRTEEVYRELVAAFRAKDPARVLEHAAVLGHYVADAHVPLHAVLNYDGQLTGQTGVHARWEAVLVDRFLRQIEPLVEPGAAAAGAEPVDVVFETLLESFGDAEKALLSDRESTDERDYAATPVDDRHADSYYSQLYEREAPRVVARLTRAAERLGSLWLSAYEDAGRPPLDLAFRFPYVRGASRLILASLDGAGAALVEDAVARGVMPNLAAHRGRGVVARAVTSFPARTATSHATLFTGAGPEAHGVTGNRVVLPGRSLLDGVSGYRSDALRAEPLWVTAARQGLHATMLCATQDHPFDPYQVERRFGGDFDRSLTFVTGYRGAHLEDAVYRARDVGLRSPSDWKEAPPEARELSLRVDATAVFGLLLDDPSDPVQGFDTLILSINKDASRAVRLKPAPPGGTDAFQPVRVTLAGQEVPIFFRLFVLDPDGSDLLLYRARAGQVLSNIALVPAATIAATGGFVGNGASRPYERGELGPTLANGGDGTAERRYLDSVRLVERQFERLLAFGEARTHWSLLFAYLPFPDEFLHLWWGLLDTSRTRHDPALAARLRPFLDEALGIADAYVGALVRHAGNGTVLAITADHGMTAVDVRIRINVALAEAGLLVRDGEGRVDLARTRAYYLGEAGQLLLNHANRPGGIVEPEEEKAVRLEVERMLRRLRHPATGAALVTAILDGGRGDLDFRLARGVFPIGDLDGPAVEVGPPRGEHLLEPERPEMHAAFAVAGEGVVAGAHLGLIDQRDVAPTLAALLGLEPPAHATGRPLAGVFARR